jgi:hypothetical protein
MPIGLVFNLESKREKDYTVEKNGLLDDIYSKNILTEGSLEDRIEISKRSCIGLDYSKAINGSHGEIVYFMMEVIEDCFLIKGRPCIDESKNKNLKLYEKGKIYKLTERIAYQLFILNKAKQL